MRFGVWCFSSSIPTPSRSASRSHHLSTTEPSCFGFMFQSRCFDFSRGGSIHHHFQNSSFYFRTFAHRGLLMMLIFSSCKQVTGASTWCSRSSYTTEYPHGQPKEHTENRDLGSRPIGLLIDAEICWKLFNFPSVNGLFKLLCVAFPW